MTQNRVHLKFSVVMTSFLVMHCR